MNARGAKAWERRAAMSAECESGQSYVLLLLLVLPLLLLAFGLAYDLGEAATGVAVAQNAADLAAQEAGRMVDVDYLDVHQEVTLRPEALAVARQVADDLTGGGFVVEAVYVEGTVVVVEGWVRVRTPFLGAFLGRHSLTPPVRGVARAAHGVEQERE
jgi:hypothetical protein